MDRFERLTSVAAPLNMINIDTDAIIPKQFLKTIARTGLGKGLFYEKRYDQQGRENPDFVLNKPAFRAARILVTGDNFGCGSSREHAPWALYDYGVRCVIAPSFADIFYNNMFKNGMLPVTLPMERVNDLIRFLLELPGAEVSVDLPAQTVTGPDGVTDHFDIDEGLKTKLLNGWDDIALTLQQMTAIEAYEDRARRDQPWR